MLALATLAIVMRLLVPQGFMPMATADGQGLVLAPCAGRDAAAARPLAAGHGESEAGHGESEDPSPDSSGTSECAFAGGQTAPAPESPGVLTTTALPEGDVVAGFPEPVSLASNARARPPATGPPVRV